MTAVRPVSSPAVAPSLRPLPAPNWARALRALRRHQLWLMVIILGWTPLLWFDGDRLINGGDINYPLDPPARFAERLFAWNPTPLGGVYNGHDFSTLFWTAGQALAYLLSPSLVVSQKAFLVLWFTLAGIGIVLLLNVLLPSPRHQIAKAMAIVFHLFNYYHLYAWEMMRLSEVPEFFAIPVLLAAYIGGIERRLSGRRVMLYLILGSIVGSSIGVNLAVLVMMPVPFAAYFLFRVVAGGTWRAPRLLMRDLGFSVAFAAVFVTLGLYWIVPWINKLQIERLYEAGQAASTYNSRALLEWTSSKNSLLNVFRLLGDVFWFDGWGGEPYMPGVYYRLVDARFLLPSFLLPVLAFLAPLLRPRNRFVLFFAVLALGTIAFSQGLHPPFGGVYEWLLARLTPMWAIRAPWQKIGFHTALSFAILAGLGAEGVARAAAPRISGLCQRWARIDVSTSFAATAVAVAVGAVQVVYMLPLVGGGMFPRQAERVKLPPFHQYTPTYIAETAAKLNAEPGPFKVLLLPEDKTNVYDWGYGGTRDVSFDLFHKNLLFQQYGEGAYTPHPIDALVRTMYRSLYADPPEPVERLLGLVRVRYLITRNDFLYDFYGDTDSPTFVADRLRHQPGVSLAQQIGAWDTYRVATSLPIPYAYAARRVYAVSGGIDGLTLGLETFDMSADDAIVVTDQLNAPRVSAGGWLSYAHPASGAASSYTLRTSTGTAIIAVETALADRYFEFEAWQTAGGTLIDGTTARQPVGETGAVGSQGRWTALATAEVTAGDHHVSISLPTPRQLATTDAVEVEPTPEGAVLPVRFASYDPAAAFVISFEYIYEDLSGERGRLAPTMGVATYTRPGGGPSDADAIRWVSDSQFRKRMMAANGTQPPIRYEIRSVLPPTSQWTRMQYELPAGPSNQAIAGVAFFTAGLESSLPAGFKAQIRNLRVHRVYDLPLVALTIAPSEVRSASPSTVHSAEQLTPTAIRMRMAHLGGKTLIVVNENFHPGWRLYVRPMQKSSSASRMQGQGGWGDWWTWRARAAPEGDHVYANGFANGWWLDLPPGEYELIAEFWPQRLFIVGAAVSAVGLLLCVLFVSVRRPLHGSPARKSRLFITSSTAPHTKRTFPEETERTTMWQLARRALEGIAPRAFNDGLARCNALGMKLIGGRRVARLLDVGCGNGELTMQFAAAAGAETVFGIEYVDAARAEAERRGITCYKEDLNRPWSLPDGHFDVVVSSQNIEHMHNTRSYLEECYRVLAPGGRLLVLTENLASWINIGALLFGWQPFSMTNVDGWSIGNPLIWHLDVPKDQEFIDCYRHTGVSGTVSHVRVLAYSGLEDVLKHVGFRSVQLHTRGYLPLRGDLSDSLCSLDRAHGHFLIATGTK